MSERGSEDWAKKVNKSKQTRWASKLNWSLVEPYMDVSLDKGTRNRENQFLTFRELHRLVDEKYSLTDIQKMGYSRHLLVFMSSFLLEKIRLPKDIFVDEYVAKGTSLEDISEKYAINRAYVTFLRQMYEIKPTGATYQNRKRTECGITDRQRQIIIGSFLGDGGRMSPSIAKYKHGMEQKPYLMWKYSELKNIASVNSLAFIPYYTDTGTYSESCRFYTKANSDVEKIISSFYDDGGRKVVRRSVLDQLEPLGLAVWFMDDGKTDFGIRKKYCASPDVYICTDSFTEEECRLICEWFKAKYGIECGVARSSKKKPRIRIKYTSVDKFFSIISPFIVPCLSYKVKWEASRDRLLDRGALAQARLSCREIVSRAPLKQSFLDLSARERDVVVESIVNTYHDAGFESIIPRKGEGDFSKLVKMDSSLLFEDKKFKFSTVGHKFCSSHFPSFWHARAKANISPADIFNNSSYLSEIVSGLLMSGKPPYDFQIRSKIRRYRGNKIISSFMPAQASSIYSVFTQGDSNRILDFCGGYGGRLLGAACSNRASSITVLEPETASYQGLLSLRHSIRKLIAPAMDIEVLNVDSNGMSTFSDDSFDFCFTSVPYFDAEEYSGSNSTAQSCVRYPIYGQWFEDFLLDSIRNAARISEKVAINVANTGSYPIADDLRKWLMENKMLMDEHRIMYPKFGGGTRLEPLFLISK